MKRSILVLIILILVGLLAILLIKMRQVPSKPVPIATPIIIEESTATVATTTIPSNSPTQTPAQPTPTAAPVLPPADEASQRLTVPEGFAVRIFAAGLEGKPRFMAVGPDSHLYISLFNAGTIARLPDRDGDGLADGVEIVASGLRAPHGLEWRDGWLYVAEVDGVSRLRDTDGDGTFETVERIISGLPGEPGHTSRTIHFGPDGLLYLSIGSSCNVCVEDDPRRAAILRFNLDGSIPADNPFANHEDERWRAVWAYGLRNSVDFLWTPAGQLWANHNGRDRMISGDGNADSLPPEEIIIPVQGGMSHGWPYCYSARMGLNQGLEAESLDWQSGLLLPIGFDCSTESVVPALYTDLAHSAPLGMTLGDASLAFPPEYQSSLYVAYHGSWNTTRASFRDCKVERIILEGEVPIGQDDFVNGFREPGQRCNSDSSWGRPADVIIGADGALYISDDLRGRVLRVVYVGE